MNRTAKLLTAVSLAALLVGCGTSHLAFRPGDLSDREKAAAIPIFLPRTAIEFRCTAVVNITERSKLLVKAADTNAGFESKDVAAAAERLGVKLNTNGANVVEFSIKDPALTARGERDPDALFFIKLDGGLFSKTEFNAQFSSDNVPGSISSTLENKGFEFTMKTIEAAAGIAGKAMSFALMKSFNPPSDDGAKKTILQTVVEQIESVREDRQTLLSGGLKAQVDEKTFARMLDELNKLEAGLVAYFKGASKETTTPLVCTIRPGAKPREAFDLFQFDEKAGFSPFADSEAVRLSALPSDFQTDKRCAGKVTLTLTPPSESESRALHQIASAKATDRGLPYRIPARSFAEVRAGSAAESESLFKAEVLIAQWGTITHLPPSVGSPGSSFKPVYYADTGALKELTVSGTPLAPDSLGSLNTATGSITDVLKARAEKDATADKAAKDKQDELARLKRQADLLEQQIRIQEFKDKLAPSGDTP